MNAILFDTHRMVKQLVAAGFTDLQAESVTDVVSAARGFDIETLATKSELKHEVGLLRAELRQGLAELRAELKQDIADLRAELKQDIADLRAELKQDIADLRAELKQDIAALDLKIADGKAELLRWVIGLAIAQTALLITVLKLLPGH